MVIVLRAAKPANENAVLLMQDPAASVASQVWAAEPRALTLFTPERPFHLNRNNLGLTVDGHGNLSPAETTNPQYRMVLQELMIGPFLPPT